MQATAKLLEMFKELDFVTEENLLACGYRSAGLLREKNFNPRIILTTIDGVEYNIDGEDNIIKEILKMKMNIRKLKLEKLNEKRKIEC